MLKQGQPKFSLFLFFNSDSRRPSRVGKRCPVTSLQDGQVCGAATPQERAPGVRPEGNRLFLHLGARRQCPLPHPRTAPGGASQGPRDPGDTRLGEWMSSGFCLPSTFLLFFGFVFVFVFFAHRPYALAVAVTLPIPQLFHDLFMC